MIKLSTLVVTEFLVSLIVGGGPVLLMHALSGVEGMVTAVKALLPPGPIVYFYAALTLSYMVVRGVNQFVFADHYRSKRLLLTMVHCLQQSGVSLLSVYRVIAGVTLTSAAIWLWFEPETATWNKTGQFGVVGVICFLVACGLSLMHMRLAAQKGESLEKLDNDPFDR